MEKLFPIAVVAALALIALPGHAQGPLTLATEGRTGYATRRRTWPPIWGGSQAPSLP